MAEVKMNLKPIYFSGKKEEFILWQNKFLAVAHYLGYDEILTGTKTYPTLPEESIAFIGEDNEGELIENVPKQQEKSTSELEDKSQQSDKDLETSMVKYEKDKEEYHTMNNRAYATLTLCFKDNLGCTAITNGKSKEFPNGDAHKARKI